VQRLELKSFFGLGRQGGLNSSYLGFVVPAIRRSLAGISADSLASNSFENQVTLYAFNTPNPANRIALHWIGRHPWSVPRRRDTSRDTPQVVFIATRNETAAAMGRSSPKNETNAA